MTTSRFDGNLQLSQRISWMGVAVGATAKVIRAPIVIAAIGAENYGLWLICMQVVGISLTYEYVIGSFVTTHISSVSDSSIAARAAEHLQIKDFLYRYYGKFILIVSLLASVALGVIFALNPPRASAAEIGIVSILTILSCCAYLYFTMYVAVLDGYGRTWPGRLGKLVYELTGILFLIGTLLIFKSVVMVAVALIFQTLVFGLVVRILYDREISKWQSVTCSMTSVEAFSARLSRRTVSLVSTQTAVVLYLYSPVFVIPILSDYISVAGYSVAQQLMMVGVYVITPILSVYLTKLVHDVKAGNLDDYLGLSFLCCATIFCLYGLVLIWASQIIELWVGPGLYLGATFVFVLVLISMFEIVYQVLRPIALCFDNESIFDKLPLRLAVSYGIAAIPCFFAASLWKGGLFLILLPTFVTSALVLVRNLYRKISLEHSHRLFDLGVRTVGGYVVIMLCAVFSEALYGGQSVVPRLVLSALIVTFGLVIVTRALGFRGAIRTGAKLFGVSH